MSSQERSNSAPVVQHNSRAWDAYVARHHPLTQPARDAEFQNPLASLAGDWLGDDIKGKQVLCLASGSGRQSALYAAAGAVVTVVDISRSMLDLDRQVAEERGLQVKLIEKSMDDLSALAESSFDIVSQPVSSCYVPDVSKVYQEVARVIKVGGIYISQHKQPMSLQSSVRPSSSGYHVEESYYRQGPLPPEHGSRHREGETLEFLHRWEALLGGLCRAGFVIEDLIEPYHADPKASVGSFSHRSWYVPPYVRIKARRRDDVSCTVNGIWTPPV